MLHIDLPISLGILVGYAGSIYAWTQAHGGFTYFNFVSTFTFLMLVGRWTQLAAVERNRHRLFGLRGTPAIERGLPSIARISTFSAADSLASGLFDMATLRRRAMRHVLGFAIVYNIVVVVVALAGKMNPLLAAGIMPASALASLAIAGLSMREPQQSRGARR